MDDGLPLPGPARRETAAEQAYRTLRREILTGSRAAGERLTEAHLATALGISRTPVREALKRLSLEGFVERENGYGVRVASVPADEVDQIFEIRMMLEAYAASRAARFATEDEIALLRQLAGRMSELTPPRGQPDFRALSETNEAFHKAVLAAARSQRLSSMLAFAVDAGLVMHTYQVYSDRDLERSAGHHHEIADAIAARAPDWAASVMRSHLLAARTATSPMREAAEQG